MGQFHREEQGVWGQHGQEVGLREVSIYPVGTEPEDHAEYTGQDGDNQGEDTP